MNMVQIVSAHIDYLDNTIVTLQDTHAGKSLQPGVTISLPVHGSVSIEAQASTLIQVPIILENPASYRLTYVIESAIDTDEPVYLLPNNKAYENMFVSITNNDSNGGTRSSGFHIGSGRCYGEFNILNNKPQHRVWGFSTRAGGDVAAYSSVWTTSRDWQLFGTISFITPCSFSAIIWRTT